MSAVRATNNRAEVLLRRHLWRLGLRYRLYNRKLVGRPDLVLARWRTVLFVDGDFWHGRILREKGIGGLRASLRTSRREWWIEKIRRNLARDDFVSTELSSQGWKVIRVWETDVLRSPDTVAADLARQIQAH
jgi:DNA mismatch endonuclease (patch repair protein)